jgi:uncharacterized protein YndB with AHSA1/START domain
MSRNRITIAAPPTSVFRVLDDPDAYPRWVVGARRIRRVDPDWPAEGSRFHHAVGTPAAELHDFTTVLERESPRRLVLEARFLPSGVAKIELDVTPTGDDGSEVTMAEHFCGGPLSHVPSLVTEPALHLRNELSLRRLRDEVERRDPPAP